MLSSSNENDLLQFKVINDLVNLSDHFPIQLCVNLCIEVSVNSGSGSESKLASKVQPQSGRLRWDHANQADCYSVSLSCMQPLLQDID